MSQPITAPEAQTLEWEVLPPETRRERAKMAALFEWVSILMDRLIRIPGMKQRLGLNPILDLVPGIGDIGAALISVSVLVYAIRRGIPKILLGRMALNVLINELVGLIPIAGSVFAFWFCANTRNYQLLREHLDTPNRSTGGDKLFVGLVLALVIFVICAGFLGTLVLFWLLGRLLSNT
jgi:Domain of unknown function (DUF4112)